MSSFKSIILEVTILYMFFFVVCFVLLCFWCMCVCGTGHFLGKAMGFLWFYSKGKQL